MTNDQDDDVRETASFKIASHKIGNLLKRLSNKNVCPCCSARALTLHAAFLAEDTIGSAEAADMFEALAASMRERDTPAPDHAASTAAH
jgi:hypothetical protein